MLRNRPPSRQARSLIAVLTLRPLDWQYGYALAKQAGLSSGTLYPLLIRLHQRGLLEAQWEPPAQSGRPARHAYRLTSAGLAFARAHQTGFGQIPLGGEAPA